MSSEITAELIEEVFGKHSDSVRFANFCNSVVIAQSSASAPTIQILSEKPGADGGMDGEWSIPADSSTAFESPFGLPGWNVFQYKARSIVGDGRQSAFSKLCSDLNGSLANLVGRLTQSKECHQYSLFTNLQLGLETATKTRDDKVLQKHRTQLKDAIARGSEGMTGVKIFDAAQLAAIANAHPALRLTYFSGQTAHSWNDAWAAEQRVKDYKVGDVAFVGRNQELNRVAEWLKDPTAKVIVLCGPSGMGKTRMALEATRPFALTTTVVDVVDELLRMDFQALGTSQTTRFIIVEDPTCDQAEALAKRAVACERLKLILTVPTDSKAPVLKLTEHAAIRILPPLQPLNNLDAENLLKAAGASFDRKALDWILLQAGGNPEILLSAAELKDGIREKSGDLKKRLYQRFRAKIEKELGVDGIRALKALCPILYVKYQGENSELNLVCDVLGLGIHPARLLELLPDLERMGYIRRRGSYASVVPPLFAARLVEELATTQDDSLRALFNALGKASRGRFLERMVTVDLLETSSFWDFVFGQNGPLESSSRTGDGVDHLDCLARAVPARTARFLETKLSDGIANSWIGSGLVSTLRELAYEGESCASGMRCLELLALKEIEQTKSLKETKLFCECFIHWYYEFPMSFQERGAWVERLIKSENRTRRLLGAHVVAFVIPPPTMLSGYAGGAARRLGQSTPRRMWREVHDYMRRLVDIRFDLTQSEEKDIAEIARDGFGDGVTQIIGHLPPDDLVNIMERLVDWNFTGKLSSDVRTLRTSIHWLEERFTDNSKKPEAEEFREKWAAVLKRIASLRERFDGGDFLLRLKIATGSAFEFEWEAGEEGRIYGYQKRLRSLAAEVAANPSLMTNEAWLILKDASAHTGEFVQYLGECDHQRHFIAHIESGVGDHTANVTFGFYCFGLFRSDPTFVEKYLDGLANNFAFDKAILLWPIRFIGPTLTNRKLLLQFIAGKSVAPTDVANMFTTGIWLNDLPVSEVAIIMEFIAQGDKWPVWAASVMNLYLHPNKALPKELIPFGERILQEIEETYDNAHRCNEIALGIAKTDLEKGFTLLEKQIAVLNTLDWRDCRGVWNPIRMHGAHEFWNYLRSENPERAYRSFCILKNRHILRSEILDDDRSLFDLENHSSILLKIANENECDAEQIAGAVSIKQPGFFPFAFDFLSGRPIDGKIASQLSSTVFERFGFGTPLEKERATLREVEAQIKSSEIPSHGRAWLERLRSNIQEAIKTSSSNSGENEYLGWS